MAVTKTGDPLLVPFVPTVIKEQQVRRLGIRNVPKIKFPVGFICTRQKNHETPGACTLNDLEMLTFHLRKRVHTNKPII